MISQQSMRTIRINLNTIIDIKILQQKLIKRQFISQIGNLRAIKKSQIENPVQEIHSTRSLRL